LTTIPRKENQSVGKFSKLNCFVENLPPVLWN
jgi:hypothetical protein